MKVEPVAYISSESFCRLFDGGNDSRGTVPVHPNQSATSKIPLYSQESIAQLQAEVERLRSDRDCEKRLRKDADDYREQAISERDQLKSWQDSIVAGYNGSAFVSRKINPTITLGYDTDDQAIAAQTAIAAMVDSHVMPAPPVGCTMGEHGCADPSQCFEPCGALGHDEAHAVVSDQEGGKQ